MTLRTVCLIPATRPGTLPLTEESARVDGWDVLVEWDHNREGVKVLRNRLFQRALEAGYDVIRYADDDDIILPHREKVLELMADGTEVVYHDSKQVCQVTGRVDILKMNPNPKHAHWYPPDVWGYVVRTSVFQKILETTGELWPGCPLGEGYFMFLEIRKTGASMKHMSQLGYEYRIAETGLHADHSDPDKFWMKKYSQEAVNLVLTHPHLF